MAIVKTVNSSSNKSCRLNISIKNKVFMISFSNSFDAVIFKTERNSLSDIFNFFNKVSALNTAEFLSGFKTVNAQDYDLDLNLITF